jgi:hypothetical protein
MRLSSFLFALLLAVACSAQTFRGRVVNGSTGNPVPSSQVILFTSSGEQGRALTNDSGEFRIVPTVNLGRQASAILQVKQDGVDYFQPVVQGRFADFKVYQSANRVSQISGQLSILQFQSVGKRLQVTELHALNNFSSPPLTQVDPNNFVLSIPSGAKVESVVVASPDGGTSRVSPTPAAESTLQYRIEFPLKPGLTKYAIRYDLPYESQKFIFQRKTQYPTDRVGIMIPQSMRFRSISPNSFHTAANSQAAQEQRFEVDNLASHSTIEFSLSGTGELVHSFSPLREGEHAAPSSLAAQTSEAARTVSPINPAPAPRRSPITGHKHSIALVIILSAAALLCFFLVRAKAAMRTVGRSFSRM